MNLFQIFATSVMGLVLVSCGSSIEPKKDYTVAPEIEQLENLKDSSKAKKSKKESVSVREAFLTFVYPVLQKNCNSCHIHAEGGTHPFAGGNEEESVSAAQRLIGSGLDDSRFYQKVSDEEVPHPTAEIATKVLPDLKTALTQFFDAIALDGSEILLAERSLASRLQEWPSVAPSGFLIFEAEGGTVKETTKFKVSLGSTSNGKVVNSNVVPSHPVSGLARGYTANTCSSNPPRITQEAHTSGGAGVAKYTVVLDGRAIRKSNGNDLRLFGRTVDFGAIRLLPLNKIPAMNTDLPDADYASDWMPDLDPDNNDIFERTKGGGNWGSGTYTVTIGNVTFTEGQIAHLINTLRTQRNSVSGRSRTNLFDTYLNDMMADLDLDNSDPSLRFAERIFDYIRLTPDVKDFGETSIRYSDWDPSDGRNLADGTTPGGEAVVGGIFNSGTLHEDQVVSNSLFDAGFVNPGLITFNVKVPEDLDFPDFAEDSSIDFRQYYRSSGNFRLRVKDIENDSYLRLRGTSTCETLNGDEGWVHRSRLITLMKGGSYSFEFHQIDQNSDVDVFMLVADTEKNEDLAVNPNTNPTILRHKFYGIGGEGSQLKSNILKWDTDFGEMSMEVFDAGGHYAMEMPIFKVDSAHIGQNVSLKGFNFRTNGNVLLTARSFNIDAVRPAGQIATYGQVLIPKDQGIEKDTIGVIFGRLESTVEEGTLPEYDESPPIEGQTCLRPDLFRELLWPVYSQQKIVLREDYDDWKDGIYPARYRAPDVMGEEPEVDLPDTPEVYTCTTCHNTEHPYLQLDAQDYLVSCDLIIARTNLGRPELSFSLRGLRGQFNHLPMYTIFNPWNGNSLRKHTLSTGEVMIHGPMQGAMSSYSKSDIESLFDGGMSDADKDTLYRRMTVAGQIGFTPDSEFGLPIFTDGDAVIEDITANDNRFNSDLSTWKRSTGNDNILEQHNQNIQKWIDRAFLIWVEAENEARGR